MSKYINPIPSLDDERVSKEFIVKFKFKDYATKEEAIEGINNAIQENDGKIDEKWVEMLGSRLRLTSPIQKGRII
nr:MAG TPA: hypothetical protein [Caudoviricetes sp.]